MNRNDKKVYTLLSCNSIQRPTEGGGMKQKRNIQIKHLENCMQRFVFHVKSVLV